MCFCVCREIWKWMYPSCLSSVILFFFFKQKTAYEMRISDWSSDVCSSDLVPGFHRQRHRRLSRIDAAAGLHPESRRHGHLAAALLSLAAARDRKSVV